MMYNLGLYRELEILLRNESQYCSEDGFLLKNAIIEAALGLRPDLLKLLLSHDALKRNFFVDVEGIVVFDKVRFQRFVMNKRFLPDSYTSFKNAIGLSDEYGNLIADSREVVLTWPFKDCVLEGGQTKEDVKRNEIFWNEILAPDEINRISEPKVFTGFKKFDSYGVHEVSDVSFDDNLVIQSNNYYSLCSLLPNNRKKFKLIYLDIPYNTGNDSFGYNDNFKHSAWLTFMKNRLELALQLLRDDGVLVVQCDDNEQAYLKVMLDCMRPLSFMNCVAVKMSEATGVKMNHAKKRFPKLKEYLLFYTMPQFEEFEDIDKYRVEQWDKENNLFLENMSIEKRGELLRVSQKEAITQADIDNINILLSDVKIVSLAKKLSNERLSETEKRDWLFDNAYRIIKTAGSNSLAKVVSSLKRPDQDMACAVSKKGVLFFYIVNYNEETPQPRLRIIFADENIEKNPCDFWQDIKTAGAIADEGGVKLENGKKPEKLLYRVIKNCTKRGDWILDFFTGSGTAAAVAMKMGRRFMVVEQLEGHIDLCVRRLCNVIDGDQTGISRSVGWYGGGSFVACSWQVLINILLIELIWPIVHQNYGIYGNRCSYMHFYRGKLNLKQLIIMSRNSKH